MKFFLSKIRDRKNLGVILFLTALCLLTFVLRVRHLGRLSLWMDEGFYRLAVDEILKHGYPLYPSGHILFKSILYVYLLSPIAALFGSSEAVLRAFSVLASVAVIPLFYLFARKSMGKAAALAACLLLSFSAWETEYSRTVIYFMPLQLVYLAGLYFFYRGFFEDRRKDKIAAVIILFFAPHIHQLAMGLIFSFAALFLIKGIRRFFRKDVLISFAVVSLSYLALQIHEAFFWKVGYVYEKNPASIREALSYFFQNFSLTYFKEILRSFPSLGLLIFFGVFLFLGEYLVRSRTTAAGTAGEQDRLASWTYLNLCLLFPLVFFGFFRTHVQPRYLFQLLPLFILLYIIALQKISMALGRIILSPFHSGEVPRKLISAASAVIFTAGAFLFSDQVGWKTTLKIVDRDYKDSLQTDIIARSGRREHYDHREPGLFVRHNRRDGDLVVAMHMVFQYIYGGPVDYWLWSGGAGTWDAWEKTPDGWKDVYVGARWINNLTDLQELIKENKNRRIWLVTTQSLFRLDHINQSIADFIRANGDKLVFLGKDALSGVYLFNDPASPLLAESHTFEMEWIPASFGRVVYEEAASKGAVLHFAGCGGKVVSASFLLPGMFAPGYYKVVLRFRTRSGTNRGKILGLSISTQGKYPVELYSRALAGGDTGAENSFRLTEGALTLSRDSGLRVVLQYSGDGEAWIDYLDVIPEKEKTVD